MIREFGTNEVWLLLLGLRWTLLLAVVALVCGCFGGLVVLVLRIAPFRAIRIGTAVFIKLFQGLPLLILLFLVFFGTNLIGFRTEAWTATAIAFTLYASVFLGEIWRGCVEAIPRGQWDAATALGLGFLRSLWLVIGPQAGRIALPPTVGFLVQLIKGTSLASIVGFEELTRTAQLVNNATFQPLFVFTLVAVLYFLLCWPLSWLSLRLELRLKRNLGHGAAS